MKDQNGNTIQDGGYLQVDDVICEIGFTSKYQARVATLDETPSIFTVYGYAWQQVCVIRNREDFTPLLPMYMSDEELAARVAQLDQECPDLDDNDPRMKMTIIKG